MLVYIDAYSRLCVFLPNTYHSHINLLEGIRNSYTRTHKYKYQIFAIQKMGLKQHARMEKESIQI